MKADKLLTIDVKFNDLQTLNESIKCIRRLLDKLKKEGKVLGYYLMRYTKGSFCGIKLILKYLKFKKGIVAMFKKQLPKIKGYCDILKIESEKKQDEIGKNSFIACIATETRNKICDSSNIKDFTEEDFSILSHYIANPLLLSYFDEAKAAVRTLNNYWHNDGLNPIKKREIGKNLINLKIPEWICIEKVDYTSLPCIIDIIKNCIKLFREKKALKTWFFTTQRFPQRHNNRPFLHLMIKPDWTKIDNLKGLEEKIRGIINYSNKDVIEFDKPDEIAGFGGYLTNKIYSALQNFSEITLKKIEDDSYKDLEMINTFNIANNIISGLAVGWLKHQLDVLFHIKEP